MSDEAVLEKPVIVVGSARSGTSILGELIQVHSTLHGIVEPRLTWRYGNDKKSDMLKPEDARPEVIAHIRRQFARQVREAGCARMLEKTPSNALRLEFVDRVFPDAKIIHITRNGIDSSLSIRSFWHQAAHGIKGTMPGKLSQRLKEVQLSQIPIYAFEAVRRFAPWPLSKLVGQNVWGPRIPGIRKLLKELDLLEVCALQWRMCVESAKLYGETLPADRYLEIRLEDLNLVTFRKILEFAGLEEEEEVMQNFQNVMDPTKSTARRSKATSEDLKTLRQWITPTMHWLGYPMD